jgi:hypothetical protein
MTRKQHITVSQYVGKHPYAPNVAVRNPHNINPDVAVFLVFVIDNWHIFTREEKRGVKITTAKSQPNSNFITYTVAATPAVWQQAKKFFDSAIKQFGSVEKAFGGN